MFKNLTLADLLSNEMFAKTLEGLDWIHSESSTSDWEVVKIKQL